jgi:hypothetical protein
LKLTQVEVHDDSNPPQTILRAADEALASMIVNVGADAPNPIPRIEPGRRMVVFMWVALAAHRTPPKTLAHDMVFLPDTADPPGPESDTSVLRGFSVAVMQHPIPVFDPPFRDGIWVAGEGPANDSPHRRTLLAIDGHIRQPERFASDWVKVGPNGDSHHGSARNEDFWDFGEPVLAVADGEVTGLADGIPDNTPRTLAAKITRDNLLGNFATLRIAPGCYVTYAHLQKGSLKITMNQHVTRGTVIALLGNSGQSTAPHLHLQVTDGNGGLESEGIPFVFRAFTDLGSGTTYETDTHPSTPRANALPPKDEVVLFSPDPGVRPRTGIPQ